MTESDRNPTQRALRECAEWLCYCLRIGWRKFELDALERQWWKYHDDSGKLRCGKKPRRERKKRDRS